MSRMSISMCEKDGVPSVITMCSASAASAARSRPGELRALEQLRAPVSSNGIGRLRTATSRSGVLVDPVHPQAAIGEASASGRPTRPKPMTETS